jgi:uncharacterized membrane protein YgcG
VTMHAAQIDGRTCTWQHARSSHQHLALTRASVAPCVWTCTVLDIARDGAAVMVDARREAARARPVPGVTSDALATRGARTADALSSRSGLISLGDLMGEDPLGEDEVSGTQYDDDEAHGLSAEAGEAGEGGGGDGGGGGGGGEGSGGGGSLSARAALEKVLEDARELLTHRYMPLT